MRRGKVFWRWRRAMADRSAIRQLRQMLVLRAAQTAAAAENAREARSVKDRASAARDEASRDRDHASDEWLRLLTEGSPDPTLVKLGGAWLIDRERALENRDLDLAIAASRFDQARQDHVQALGREGATRKIKSKAQKAFAHVSEERAASQMTDAMLWRRVR